MSFKNKVCWITGASSGIGEALADELSVRGARLILSSRNRDRLDSVRKRNLSNSPDIQILPLDLGQADQLPAIAEKAIGFFGHIDYLFNNAGISQRATVKDLDMKVLEHIMQVNFFGPVALTKTVLNDMIHHQSGHIVIISSVMGKFGTQLRSGYSASKHALHGFFDSLRNEVYRNNIKITLICPGYVHTQVSVNAVKGDGSPLGKMEPGQEHGMQPHACVLKILKAVEREKLEVYIGGTEILGVYLKRFFPNLLFRILRNREVR